ncbi:MAG TPA: beta-ketoacyl-ACP synthase III [Phycisphaerae bacterium]|nr:beta-ketoacyl-ACP synthase III [Phycisphaerae bacterium]
MASVARAIISGTGRAVPAQVLDNAYFCGYLDTSDEWITSRSGIKERRRAGDGETTVTLARDAARIALDDAGIAATDLDMIIFATVTPDTSVPAAACWLQAELGAIGAPAFDTNAACAGLAYAMVQASTFIETGKYRNILVVGSETLSRITNYEDRTTCVLFGDGAAAVVMSATQEMDRGIIHYVIGADGNGAAHIHVPAGGSRMPASEMSVAERLHSIRMNGREVYKFAVQKFNSLVQETLDGAHVSAEELALIIPHQSNLRIIQSVQQKLGLPDEKFVVNIDRYGNTSSASIGLALDEARRDGRIKPRDLVMMIGFGAGLTWGSLLCRM